MRPMSLAAFSPDLLDLDTEAFADFSSKPLADARNGLYSSVNGVNITVFHCSSENLDLQSLQTRAVEKHTELIREFGLELVAVKRNAEIANPESEIQPCHRTTFRLPSQDFK